MLNALSVSLRGGDPGGRARAAKSFVRQGFIAAGSFAWEDGVIDGWAHPSQVAVADASVRTADGYACCVGPLWYRGRFGAAALGALLEDLGTVGRVDESALRGNFALFLYRNRHCLLMNDAPGFVRIHASADRSFYSTSWLATCAYSGSVELDEAAAVEYVLLGASHSDATVACGITTLPLAHAFDLAQRRTLQRVPAGAWTRDRAPATFDEAAEEGADLLRATFGDIAAAFPGRLRTALSGGFDSRLILAGLLDSGARPELFVYGDTGSEDVPIARAVAASAELPLEVIDKSVLEARRAPLDVERMVEGALFFDGLPNDGIHDTGVDRQTRLAQTADGYLGLNGGGGEIFRNYFHLPDRPFRALDIVRTFYRGFDANVFRRRGGLRDYMDRLAASIQRVLGIDDARPRPTLTREQVELLYPLFRCHHWMGVNNSVALRHGYFATPLLDLGLIRLASRLPLAWKNAGRLEARLVTRLHPGIAMQPSAYGFRFGDGPDWRARFNEWSMCARPVAARPLIGATRRRLHGTGAAADMIARSRAILPGEWRMDPVLDLARLPDDYAFARALAVEIAWRELLA